MRKTSFWTLALVAALVILGGCGTEHGDDHAEADHSHDAAEQADAGHAEDGHDHGEPGHAHEAAPPTEEVLAILAKADAVDGSADHVVSKCSGCSLHMDGSAEHAWEVGDYELHFCSESCKESFEVKGQAAILAMAVPE